MIIIYYILFPFAMFVLGLITSKAASLLTLPISLPISYLYKSKLDEEGSQPFRIDHAIAFFVHGILLVFVLKWITDYLEIKIAIWYWIICFFIKTYSDYLARWNHPNIQTPIPKIIGYIAGIAYFVW